MAYTVKQVAKMSGVSVRTLHFYDEMGLLKPAYHGANGYRYYEEPQLLRLQQILFYRELGFELKQIQKALTRPEFENVSALQAHREVLEENIARARTLIGTIDKTLDHLKGSLIMSSEEMFAGFIGRRRQGPIRRADPVGRGTGGLQGIFAGHARRDVRFRDYRHGRRTTASAPRTG